MNAILPDSMAPLSAQDAADAFAAILDGRVTADALTRFLVTMADRGETAIEVAAAARAMRARMIRIGGPAGAIDVCGTGGDGSHSLNISTAVAIVVAACGVPVAKHGNRAASSKAGAADTLEAMGLDLDRASTMAEQSLADIGIAFLFAPKHHPALGPIMPVRRAIGRRTIFNLLGPLCNPAGVRSQLVGVPMPELIPLYTDAMQLLGMERAMVVSGTEGLDELSIAGSSHLSTIGFAMPSAVVVPEDAGLFRYPADALRGGDAAFNAAALSRLLDGEPGAYRDAVLLNSAAALIVAGRAHDWLSGVEEAAEAIDRGLASALLNCWVHF